MIIHLMQDPGPPPYEPLVIIDRSPFHSSLPRDRSATSKLERWMPRAAMTGIASRLAWLASGGSQRRVDASVPTSPPWTAPAADTLMTGSADR
jgi:hypothetical protein